MSQHFIPAVILAGGAARRMGGGDKPLRLIQNRPILDWIIARLSPQTHPIAINANGDPSRFNSYGFDILPDHAPDIGPMAGILAALEWVAPRDPTVTHVLTVSGDTPFLPADLVGSLVKAVSDRPTAMAVAKSAGRIHPAIALWPVTAREMIAKALNAEEGRRVESWLGIFDAEIIEWTVVPYDPFFNVNTPADIDDAEKTANLIFRPE